MARTQKLRWIESVPVPSEGKTYYTIVEAFPDDPAPTWDQVLKGKRYASKRAAEKALRKEQ